MSASVVIELAGVPVGKGRPRFVRKTGHAYTPAKTEKYESHLRYAAQEAMTGRALLDGPVSVAITVHLPIAPSWPKRRQEAARQGALLPTSRPDIDNYLKAAADALNGVVFNDDSQIVDCCISKTYSDKPRLTIQVTALMANRAEAA